MMESEKKCKYAGNNEFDDAEKLNEQFESKQKVSQQKGSKHSDFQVHNCGRENNKFLRDLYNTPKQKIAIYKQTNNQKLREEIILENMNLVRYVVYEFFSFSDVDEQDLMSYGNEGLILALENYNVNYNCSFTAYAISNIKGHIQRGIDEVLLGEKSCFYIDALTAKNIVEKANGLTILDNPNLIDDIIELLVASGRNSGSKIYRETARRKIISLFIGDVSLDDEELINSGYILDENDFTDDIIDSIIKEDLIKKMLGVLSNREKNILKLLFGLYNEETKTLEEIASIYNISRARAGLIKKRILIKLKRLF